MPPGKRTLIILYAITTASPLSGCAALVRFQSRTQNATNSTLPMSLSGKSEMNSNDRGEGHMGLRSCVSRRLNLTTNGCLTPLPHRPTTEPASQLSRTYPAPFAQVFAGRLSVTTTKIRHYTLAARPHGGHHRGLRERRRAVHARNWRPYLKWMQFQHPRRGCPGFFQPPELGKRAANCT